VKNGLNRFFGTRWAMVLTGSMIGLLAALLQKLGNPSGGGLCITCFIRDTAGGIGLHRVEGGQYIRPEIIGLVLGSTISALVFKEFRARGGSAPVIRFCLGCAAMIGALTFMGCPFGIIQKLASGNLSAILALVGLLAGVWSGVQFIKAGFDLGRPQETRAINGWILPVVMAGLFLVQEFDLRVNDHSAPFHSWAEPSSLFVPAFIALGAGIVIGFLGQRTRFCTIGAFRDMMLIRSGHYLWGVIAMLFADALGNLLFGGMKLSMFSGTPGFTITPLDFIFSVLGAVLTGLALTLAGGCAGRQLFLSGEGDGDAVIFVLGMFFGAALTYNFSVFRRPACGIIADIHTRPLGMAAILLGLVFCMATGFAMRHKWRDSM
jgi:YedE family putative selenium metabolism protein